MTKLRRPEDKITKARRASVDKKRRIKIKEKVFQHYGGNPPRCACCGETIPEFLSVDHIHGTDDSRNRSHRLYVWLFHKNFPPGFQILCHNCNFAKGHYGECPHEKSKRLDEQLKIVQEEMNARRRSNG